LSQNVRKPAKNRVIRSG